MTFDHIAIEQQGNDPENDFAVTGYPIDKNNLGLLLRLSFDRWEFGAGYIPHEPTGKPQSRLQVLKSEPKSQDYDMT